MNKVFIQTNSKQILGAYMGKYAIFKNLKDKNSVEVKIINVDDLDIFKSFHGKKYLKNGELVTYDSNDLQSFTLTRFMPPQLMNYAGRAVVIDPDIFALTDINELFNIDMQGKAIACRGKNNEWKSSVMLLDCQKLKHWRMGEILKKLENKKLDYSDMIILRIENSILEIPEFWNSFDHLDENTKMLHTTERLTQPWRTGLQIDFTRNKMRKFFGIIPREPIHKLLGKYKTKYQPHPDKQIEEFFFALIKDALNEGFVSEEFVRSEIEKKHIRADAFEIINRIN